MRQGTFGNLKHLFKEEKKNLNQEHTTLIYKQDSQTFCEKVFMLVKKGVKKKKKKKNVIK